jgi:dolichol-phosphate mannosyltransferase
MLADGRRVIVVIPAYDEEARISRALIGMPAVVDLALVVDDGSTDRTADIAREHGATVVSLPRHTNIDTALRAGFDVALHDGYGIIVIMAGNGKDDPTEIPRLLKPIEEDGYDFVQGSRYLPGGKHAHMPFHRTFGTHLYPWLLRLTTGFRATDGTNGFRALKSSILRDPKIDIRQSWLDPYGTELYLVLKVIQLGYRITEVPVSKIYPNTKKYHSYTKIRPITDWWNILRPLFYLTLRLRN